MEFAKIGTQGLDVPSAKESGRAAFSKQRGETPENVFYRGIRMFFLGNAFLRSFGMVLFYHARNSETIKEPLKNDETA